jgi:hypothetical protein
METTDITIDVLRGIQATLGRIEREAHTSNERLARLELHAEATNERLGSLERHAIATRESIELLGTQAITAGRALTTQMEARLRLDQRVDAIERRLDEIERRG